MANQNEILEMLKMMNDRFDKMNDRFDVLETQSNYTNSRLEKLSTDTNSRLEKLSTDTNSRFEKLSNDTNSRLEKLSMGINELRGDMTERNLRHEVRKMYGDAYGDVFVIQGVDGLIRLACGSKRQDSQYYPRDLTKVTGFDMRSGHNKSDSQRTRDSIDVLCNYLYNENAGNIALERFLMGFGWTKDKIEKRTKGFSVFNDVKEENVNARNVLLDELMKEIKEGKSSEEVDAFVKFMKFTKLTKGEQRKAIESDSGIFILLFCSMFNDISVIKFPIIDLELDCRGRIFFHDISAGEKQCFIEIGEIKSSTEKNIIEKATRQLILRLKTISKAVMILEGMGEESISSVGKVSVPSSALHRNKNKYDDHSAADEPISIDGCTIRIEYISA